LPMKHKPVVTADYLVCPTCFELLTRDDIEEFGACPYCDHSFAMNSEIEDFILRPVVQQWIRQTRRLEDEAVSL